MIRILFLFAIIGMTATAFAEKIKGVSFVAASKMIDSSHVAPIVNVNAKWVSLMPFGFIDKGEVKFDSHFQWIGEKSEGIRHVIKLCQNQDLAIMLKPQVWIPNGFTGDFQCTNESDWRKFESSYEKYILNFARIAEENEVPLFCVGTEWEIFSTTREKFWIELIDKVKAVYHGELTYAANWDEFGKLKFWNKLDYIGIDAYFPLGNSPRCSKNQLADAWGKINQQLAQFSQKQKKKIIFTEIGYRSIKECFMQPWDSTIKGSFSANHQLNAYQALFSNVWQESWFNGLFIWKWHHDHSSFQAVENDRFTPQGKPAEIFLREFWKNN